MKIKSKKHEMREAVRTANNRRRNATAVPGAGQAMNMLKFEIADELGLVDRIEEVGYENMTTKECGSIGGLMTRRMIEYAQKHMKKELDEGRSLSFMRDKEYEKWDSNIETVEEQPRYH